jgi:hypothetical protein
MTSEEYRTVLRNLIDDLATDYKFGTAVAEKIVSKADMEKHSYSEYEVEQYAYELADLVSVCIKISRG